jgi:regulator of sigma D
VIVFHQLVVNDIREEVWQMYRDMAYTSLARVNPEFIERLSKTGRLDNFLDTLSEFAADAHFEIERQILEQYKASDEYRKNINNPKMISYVVNSIDRSVIDMIPDLIDQALTPGSDIMEELEKEEDDYEEFQRRCNKLFLSRDEDDDEDDEDETEGPVLVADLEEYLRREMKRNTIPAEEVAAGSGKDKSDDDDE